jgi:hypothetical protein
VHRGIGVQVEPFTSCDIDVRDTDRCARKCRYSVCYAVSQSACASSYRLPATGFLRDAGSR